MKKRDMSEAKPRVYKVQGFLYPDSVWPDFVTYRKSRRKVSQAHNRIIKAMTEKYPNHHRIEITYSVDWGTNA